jgi:septal ring factor EnvC (AmiA/AmiB activator)
MAPSNVANLSPIDEDVSIETQEEQRLDQQIDKHIRQIDRRIGQIGKSIAQINESIQQTDVYIKAIDKLALRLSATRHNANAQYANYTAYKDADSLVPLHHYLTDENIPGFPDKTGDINLLHSKSYS